MNNSIDLCPLFSTHHSASIDSRLVVLSLILFQGVLTLVQAEQLPIKIYTTVDGLARNQINRIARDPRGFLWLCTPEGLSRFDGYQFTNYTTEHGLSHHSVRDLLETRNGVYWVATGDGVCRFNPTGSRMQIAEDNLNPQSAF